MMLLRKQQRARRGSLFSGVKGSTAFLCSLIARDGGDCLVKFGSCDEGVPMTVMSPAVFEAAEKWFEASCCRPVWKNEREWRWSDVAGDYQFFTPENRDPATAFVGIPLNEAEVELYNSFVGKRVPMQQLLDGDQIRGDAGVGFLVEHTRLTLWLRALRLGLLNPPEKLYSQALGAKPKTTKTNPGAYFNLPDEFQCVKNFLNPNSQNADDDMGDDLILLAEHKDNLWRHWRQNLEKKSYDDAYGEGPVYKLLYNDFVQGLSCSKVDSAPDDSTSSKSDFVLVDRAEVAPQGLDLTPAEKDEFVIVTGEDKLWRRDSKNFPSLKVRYRPDSGVQLPGRYCQNHY